jgi:DNA-binding response OmpR family regulator
MKQDDLFSMLQGLYKNTSQCPNLLAVGWDVDSAQVVQLAAIDFDLDYVGKVGAALRHLRKSEKVEAVLINVNGDFDVFVATAALRLYTSAPIILLFSDEKPVNPILAVEAGADDWLPSTIHPREFAARVYARIRRHRFNQQPATVLGYPKQLPSGHGLKQQRPMA